MKAAKQREDLVKAPIEVIDSDGDEDDVRMDDEEQKQLQKGKVIKVQSILTPGYSVNTFVVAQIGYLCL